MKRILSLLVLSSSFLASFAQLDNTVEVTNEVKPVVTDAKKVDVKTQVAETKVTHYTMQYAVEGQPLSNYVPEPLGDYESEAVWKGNKKGYVHLAGGVLGKLDGQAVYQFDLTENDALTLDFSLKGFNGKTRKNEFFHPTNWKSRDYQNRTALKYNHRFDNGMDFCAKGAFENRLYNYMYTGTTGTTDKQHDVLANAVVGFTPYEVGNFSISATAGIDFFSQNYRTTLADKLGETLLHADVDAAYQFSDEHGVDLGIGAFHSAYGNDELKGISRLRFTPHYTYSADLMDLQLGLFVSTKGNVAPDASFTYHLNPKSDVFVEVTGEEEDNTFRAFSAEHPYFAMLNDAPGEKQKMESAFYQLETSIGYRFKDFYGLNGQISATYEQGKNELATEWIDTDALGHQVCFVEFYKCHDFMIDADFSYAFGDILKLETKHELCIERWKDEEANKWVKGNYSTPIFSMDWKADVKLMKGFYLGLDWQYKTFYQEDLGTAEDPQYKRPDIVNLGASLRYTLPIKQPLTIFVKGDNLLNHNHDLYYGYRNIGANFLGGFALSF